MTPEEFWSQSAVEMTAEEAAKYKSTEDLDPTRFDTFVDGNCLGHADLKPDTECSCPLHPKTCEYEGHSCETCDEHVAKCANFAAWLAARAKPSAT